MHCALRQALTGSLRRNPRQQSRSNKLLFNRVTRSNSRETVNFVLSRNSGGLTVLTRKLYIRIGLHKMCGLDEFLAVYFAPTS
jgi:hypothetical protein